MLAGERRTMSVARLVLVGALVVGAVLFVIGTRGEHHDATATTASATTSTTVLRTSTTSNGATTTELASFAAATSTTAQAAEGTPQREAAERRATTVPAGHPASTVPATTAPGPTATAGVGEGTPAREAAEGGSPTAGSHIETAAERSNETVAGVNLESVGIVAGVVIVSILLAGLALARRFGMVLWVAAGFCALVAAADLAELARQVDRSRTGLAMIAAAVAVTHVVGVIAGTLAAREPA